MMRWAFLLAGLLGLLLLAVNFWPQHVAYANGLGADLNALTPEPQAPSGQSTPVTKLGTPVASPTGRPSPAPDANFSGWEREALHDLAAVVGWPTAVVYSSSGRLEVRSEPTPGEWKTAHIRAFDYSAGARAGFSAEQEDSRVGGFTVSQEEFFSYPAYSATLTDNSGRVVERRFRWLGTTWILGVDIRGIDARSAESTRLVSEQFLSIAVWRGFPPPAGGGAPTPNPTWSLTPAGTPSATPCAADFRDVGPSYWAYEYIYRLACRGVVSGYSDGTFLPENPTTRAQLAKMLVMSQGWPLSEPAQPTFLDVGPAHPFFTYIETAAGHGVISGYAGGTYRPDSFVTRAQVAKMLVLTTGWTIDTQSPVLLRDVPSSFWAWPYIQSAIQHGVFTGYGDSYFRPSMLATRAQLAKVLVLSIAP